MNAWKMYAGNSVAATLVASVLAYHNVWSSATYFAIMAVVCAVWAWDTYIGI